MYCTSEHRTFTSKASALARPCRLLSVIIQICPSRWPRGLRLWVCGRSLAGPVGSNPAGGMDVCLLWVLRVVR
jgi:hypothetical protein